jgi:hypothetical protein
MDGGEEGYCRTWKEPRHVLAVPIFSQIYPRSMGKSDERRVFYYVL